jgi:glycerol-3-phosphate O-acyltransferase
MRLNVALIVLLVLLIILFAFRKPIRRYLERKFRKYSRAAIHRFRARVERFKLTQKKYIKYQLMKEPAVWQAMEAHERQHHLSPERTLERVEGYIDEIVPHFNILSYYAFGYRLAHFLLNLVYNVVIDKKNFEELKKIPRDSVVIYIMNHRSNVDYVLVAYMLAERISLSYAVGEWARVWPLEYIFKSFGSYFIRRKYREPLYHTVLEKYIQLISKNGITQGIFIEGGLSRDGSLREPKIGLLDYIIRTIQDPGFTKDLVFVPVGINYDRVLEDLSLVGEAHGAPPEKRGLGKVLSGLSVIVTVPRVIVRNGFYYIFRGVRKYGYTSVAVGEHVSLRDYVARLDRDIFTLDADEYKKEVKRFSQHVLEGVGRVVPVTPVTFVAYALLADGREVIPQADLVELMTEMKKALVLNSARIVRGKEFVDLMMEKRRLAFEADDRTGELLSFERGVIDMEEMQKTIDLAMEVLSLRKIARKKKDAIVINPKRREVLTYYANSIGQLFERRR